jgi:alpha-beta hydrolase superfamily lysophospholipase
MSTSASGSASAETIVLIHGMWMTPLSWEHYASHYIDRGHRVIAPAWPGQDGWEELADYMLNWTTTHARAGTGQPAAAREEASISRD